MEQVSKSKALTSLCLAFTAGVLTLPAISLVDLRASPLSECDSVKDCSKQMVVIANNILDQNVALLKRVGALESDLEKYKSDDAKALESRVNQLRSGKNSNDFPGGNKTTGVCPPGKFMVGARIQDDPGGGNGIISFIGPICRDLP